MDRPISPGFLWLAGVGCYLTLRLCVAGFVNLVRDVNRGYPSERCSLAAGLLLIAISAPVALAWHLVTYAVKILHEASVSQP
jgi:hypothetical protein